MEILILITFVQLCLSAKNKLVLRPVGREYQAVVPKLSGGKYYGVSYVIQVHFFLFPKRPYSPCARLTFRHESSMF